MMWNVWPISKTTTDHSSATQGMLQQPRYPTTVDLDASKYTIIFLHVNEVFYIPRGTCHNSTISSQEQHGTPSWYIVFYMEPITTTGSINTTSSRRRSDDVVTVADWISLCLDDVDHDNTYQPWIRLAAALFPSMRAHPCVS
jgi:hypothetical protein